MFDEDRKIEKDFGTIVAERRRRKENFVRFLKSAKNFWKNRREL